MYTYTIVLGRLLNFLQGRKKTEKIGSQMQCFSSALFLLSTKSHSNHAQNDKCTGNGDERNKVVAKYDSMTS